MRLALLILVVSTSAASTSQASPPARPTDGSLRRAWERNAHTVVEVSRKDGRRGAGVIVGADGHIATSTHNVDFETATVHLDGQSHTARVIAADARTRVALLQLSLPADHGPLRAPEANTKATLEKAHWLVGIEPNDKGTKPALGKVLQPVTSPRPHLLTELSLPPGSPLFDERGRLVALVVERSGRHASLAVPLSTVQAQAQAALALPEVKPHAENAAP